MTTLGTLVVQFISTDLRAFPSGVPKIVHRLRALPCEAGSGQKIVGFLIGPVDSKEVGLIGGVAIPTPYTPS